MALDIEKIAESLHHVHEFRNWVRSNVLFPTVPDRIVHPLLAQLGEVEGVLVSIMFDHGEVDRLKAISDTLDRVPA